MKVKSSIWLFALAVTALPGGILAKSVSRPNYIYVENGVYFYAAAITPQQRKAGQIAGDAVGYRYFGQNAAGEYVLARVSGNGSIEAFTYCKNPCRVIRTSASERFVNNSLLLVSSAFSDAFRGRLRNTNPTIQNSHINIPSRSPIDSNGLNGFIKTTNGVIIPASTDSAVRATADGMVRFTGQLDAYGNVIRIDHGGGVQTLYGNLAKMAVTPKDTVKKGQVIGFVGTARNGTGAELIYEVRVEGKSVDPLAYMKDGDAEFQALFQTWKKLKEKQQ